MNIDKKLLRVGIWFTDENGNYIQHYDEDAKPPEGAAFAHVCFPLEVTERIYKIRDDGSFSDRVCSFNTHIGRANGRLIVAMVNSGDYDLYEAIAIYASACERCSNVLWHKYLPDEDGYAEFSDEWYAANTECDFCRDLGIEVD